jgi:hypothetical protein
MKVTNLTQYPKLNSKNIPLHYSELEDKLKRVFSFANARNLQAFITTQSIDVIKYFVRVANETDEKDIRLFRLEEYEDGSLDAIPYRLENILSSLERHLEFR